MPSIDTTVPLMDALAVFRDSLRLLLRALRIGMIALKVGISKPILNASTVATVDGTKDIWSLY